MIPATIGSEISQGTAIGRIDNVGTANTLTDLNLARVRCSKTLHDISLFPVPFSDVKLKTHFRVVGRRREDVPPVVIWVCQDTTSGEILGNTVYRSLSDATCLSPGRLLCTLIREYRQVPRIIRVVPSTEEEVRAFSRIEKLLASALGDLVEKPVFHYNTVGTLSQALSLQARSLLLGLGRKFTLIRLSISRAMKSPFWDATNSIQLESFYFVWGRILRDFACLQFQNWNKNAIRPSGLQDSNSVNEFSCLKQEDAHRLAAHLETDLITWAGPAPSHWNDYPAIRDAIERCWAKHNYFHLHVENAWDAIDFFQERIELFMKEQTSARHQIPSDSLDIATLIYEKCADVADN